MTINDPSRHRGNSNTVRYITFTSEANTQHVPIICQTLSQTFRESLIIPLQILNIMIPLHYHMDTDCIKERKQMIHFSIYKYWEPYDVVPKHCLVDSTDEEM
jgi:hypothetical protein